MLKYQINYQKDFIDAIFQNDLIAKALEEAIRQNKITLISALQKKLDTSITSINYTKYFTKEIFLGTFEALLKEKIVEQIFENYQPNFSVKQQALFVLQSDYVSKLVKDPHFSSLVFNTIIAENISDADWKQLLEEIYFD